MRRYQDISRPRGRYHYVAVDCAAAVPVAVTIVVVAAVMYLTFADWAVVLRAAGM